MFFPISDDDRQISGPVFVTYVFLAFNVALFLYQLSNEAFTYGWSAVPAEITTGIDLVGSSELQVGAQSIAIPQEPGPSPIWLTLLSSMFMHGGWAHLGGNMLYLWIFGNNVEHRFGHFRFVIFYVLSGLAASAAQIATDPDSVIPTLGASGAISGVLGAYLVLFPRNKVNAVVFFRVVSIPAIFVIGMWAVMQFVSGWGSIASTEQTGGGVAYAAHIGGFIAGVLIALACRLILKEKEHDDVLTRQYRDDNRTKRLW